MQAKSSLDYISKAEIFKGLPTECYRFLAAKAVHRNYKLGETVGSEGTRTGFMFSVLSGRLSCLKFSTEGRKVVFGYVEPGSWLGHYWAFGDGVAVMNVEAVVDSVCLQIPSSALREAGRLWPAMYEGLYLELIRVTRPLYNNLERSVAYPSRVRVAVVLLSLLHRHQLKTPKGMQLDLPVSQIELASMSSCSRQYTNKIMQEWSRRGIVSIVGRRTILVRNLDALIAEAEPSGHIPSTWFNSRNRAPQTVGAAQR